MFITAYSRYDRYRIPIYDVSVVFHTQVSLNFLSSVRPTLFNKVFSSVSYLTVASWI